ncbi:hypothetical protein M404DRAFT_34612 [Pisolithus tinctorius Marx 270]|uniref:Uncharacterized protein n=1 Tax=Pisolithus tinctorius Marx 270 TaxID=870435 RepID=A0A0C3JB87_PISTI|nr:hypothetical protein M404DRAFT_34612 [Pisolithus tinctorius Marx 270]
MLIGYCCEAHLASAHGIVNMPRTQLVECGRCGKRWDTGLCCGTIARSVSGSAVDERMFHGTLHSPKDRCPCVTGYPLSTGCTSAIQVSLRAGDGGLGAVQSFAVKASALAYIEIDICGSAGYDTPTPNSPALGMSRAPPTLVGNHLPGVVPEWLAVTSSTAAL